MSSFQEPIAIIGVGGVFPGADPGLAAFWEMIERGRSAAGEPPRGRWALSPDEVHDPAVAAPDKVNSRRGCYLRGFSFDPAGFDLDPGFLAGLDPMFHVALSASRDALRSADLRGTDPARVGVIFGNIALPTDGSSKLAAEYLGRTFEEALLGPEAGLKSRRPPAINRFVAGLPAGLVAKALGLGGGGYTLDAACASSLYALKLAADELSSGRADAMLAGGLSRPDCLYTQMGFSQLRAVSPNGVCSPFDEKGNGLVVGEGAGMFVLKRLEDAFRSGDKIHGVIRGIGLSNDVEGNLLAPSSEGQLRAMRKAYAAARWDPRDVDLVECHATGTPVGDAVEYRGLRALWGDSGWSPGDCVIGSVKSNVGHLLTGAGAAGLMKVVLAIKNKTLPPSANFARPGNAIDLGRGPFRVNRASESWKRRPGRKPRRAAVSGFGFGGINAHVLVEEWIPSKKTPRGRKTNPAAARPAVAVVGMSARFGPWSGLESFRERVFGGGPDFPKTLPRWRGAETSRWFREAGLTPERFAGHYIDSLSVPAGRFRIPPVEFQDMLPQQTLMLLTADEALADAGLDPRVEPARPWLDAGVFIGTGLDLNTTNFHFRWIIANKAPGWARKLGLPDSGPEFDRWAGELRDAAGPPLSANRTMGALGGIVASRVAREFRIGGPSFTIQSEESSGLRALEAAVRALQSGEVNAAMAGAVDLAGDLRAVLGTHEGRPYSSSGSARPFDAAADGTVPGEGAAAVVLKRLEDAVKDGDRIYSVVRGIGTAFGGGADTLVPRAQAYAKAVQDARRESGCASVSFIEAHGSGCGPEDRMELDALSSVAGDPAAPCFLGSVKSDIGHAGAASGMASFVKASLCLYHEFIPALRGHRSPSPEPTGPASAFRIPARPSYWIRDRERGPRRAGVSSFGVDGGVGHAILESHDGPDSRRARVPLGEALFAVVGESPEDLLRGLDKLRREASAADGIEAFARKWNRENPLGAAKLAVALVAGSPEDAALAAREARDAIGTDPSKPLGSGSRDRVFYRPDPAGAKGGAAFVFPGFGNHFAGMGRELAASWPEVFRAQDAENGFLRGQFLPDLFWNAFHSPDAGAPDARSAIQGAVSLGTAVGDLVRSFGVTPEAVIGYSLGESTGLFATRVWRDRDEMLRRMNSSPLFTRDLVGEFLSAKAAWGLPKGTRADWVMGVVDASREAVERAIAGAERVYLLIVNSPAECVIGGERARVADAVAALGCRFVEVPGAPSMHCPAAEPVRRAYRDLHLFAAHPAEGLRFYKGSTGLPYAPDAESAADAVTEGATGMIDFPRVVESAYRDGIRVFVEVGPGASVTRMIASVLAGRPHAAIPVCTVESPGARGVLVALGRLIADRVPVDLDRLYAGAGDASEPAREMVPAVRIPVGGEPFVLPGAPAPENPRPAPSREADARPATPVPLRSPRPVPARGATAVIERLRSAESAKMRAHEAFLRFSAALTEAYAAETGPAVFMDREACLTFAVGRIGAVLGPEFSEVDAHPTRVRLPDEPLMLVDRILSVEGEPRSMSSGRVVTEHDVLPGAWYLDGGRIPTCVAVEAGQADLFLSGYLGIDFKTKGKAVYRLLDAVVTFHDGLPAPGETIRYDIRIDGFFRQGDTYLFRFRFDGTVNGRTVITMRDGCAGFFTAAELAAGKGVVHTAMDLKRVPGKKPADWRELVPAAAGPLDDEKLRALRAGDLAAAFGPAFSGLGLARPGTIPGSLSGDRMRLFDRVVELDPVGGRFGLGMITAEADIHPGDWFLTCHFVDDRVMPGTLMYECCLHTLRVFLLSLGWVGEDGAVVCEPVPGIKSRLKCRGQVIESTRTAAYRISVKELGYLPDGTPYAVADALMFADGRAIVEITDMSARLSGLTQEGLEAMWDAPRAGCEAAPGAKPAVFDDRSILAFAVGKPSEAFGEPYRVFDAERVIARLPGPPYKFLDRITEVRAEAWKLKAGGTIEAQYDVPAGEWYFSSERQDRMPFAVLLEVALQPCGWFAAYLGSALTSETDLSFRNLGGTGVQLQPVGPDAGTLTTAVKITRVSNSAGMIIQHYDFQMTGRNGLIYKGNTYFGFFTKAALADQVGLRDAVPYEPGPDEAARGESLPYPRSAPYPDDAMRMVGQIDLFVPDGGPARLGFIRGSIPVDPAAWFFKAHFHQDPVWPGSLGLESFLQLLKFAAVRRWGVETRFECQALGRAHHWIYRGQILPSDKKVTVQAAVTAVDDDLRLLVADGFLSVDGRVIYEMKDFTLRTLRPGGEA